jgi:hypothetical protein
VHLILGAISLALIFNSDKGTNLDSMLNRATYDYSSLATVFGGILKTIFWDPGLDLPVLPVLGFISIFFLRKNRLLFGGMLLVQWLLVIILGFKGLHELRPRRFLLVDFYSIVVLLAVVQQLSGYVNTKPWVRYGSYMMSIILVSGCIWQFVDLGKFTSIPVKTRNRTLPYTASAADYYVNAQYVDAGNSLIKMIKDGKKIILIYNYYTYQENTTDPVALLERLYLKLGHNRFKSSVLVFSNKLDRYSRVPIIPLSEIEATLHDINVMTFNKDTENWLDDYIVVKHPGKTFREFKEEASSIMKYLQDNFALIRLKQDIPPFILYKVFPADYNLERLNKSRAVMD